MEKNSVGPVEYMVVSFPGNQFKGDIVPALADLVESGTVRILDLAFVSKDRAGNITSLEMEDLKTPAGTAFQALQSFVGDLVNSDDLDAVGDALDPDSSAALLVWEDLWAARFAAAIRDAGGQILDLERVPRDVVEAAIDYTAANQ